jgi:hypothetical protein
MLFYNIFIVTGYPYVFFTCLYENGFVSNKTCEGYDVGEQMFMQNWIIVSYVCVFMLIKTFVQDNPCRHPVLILNDIHVDVLEALMTYMYQGTVSVPHNKLQVIT